MTPSPLIHRGSRSFGGQRHRGLRHFPSTLFVEADGVHHDGVERHVDAPAQRRELRQRLADQRRALSPTERIVAAQGLRRSLEQLPEYFTDVRVAGYWATQGELPLNLAIAPLAARGQQFLLPIIDAGKRLRFAPWTSGDAVQANRYGVPEPAAPAQLLEPFQLDLVLVPLLGFDRRGNRLGYGGGYYDRSFAFLNEQARPTEPLLVGIAYAFQELANVGEEDWDVRLDFVATERELIDCTTPDPATESAA